MERAPATTFTLSEEAFLLSSLSEVVKVWARGSGQANFNLSIDDGVADLQLNFKLGHPTAAHIHQEQCEPVYPPHHQEGGHLPNKRKVRKSPSRRNRDCARAAQHQTRLRQLGLAAASNCDAADPVPDIVLPFSGKLIQVKPSLPSSTMEDPSATAPVATPPLSTPPLVAPTKPSTPAANTPRRVDVDLAKRQLFPAAGNPKPPSQVNQPKTYKQMEDKMWSRLFPP